MRDVFLVGNAVGRSLWQREDVVAVGVLALLKVAASACLLWLGFSHISDDDFSRIVIAEGFAHAPRLDPSGTSWLPFPFWIMGTAMAAFGRTLDTARVVGITAGMVSVVLPYVAARWAGVQRSTASIAVGVWMLSPWHAWLGAATVPEALTSGLIVFGALGTLQPGRRKILGGVALSLACLSRYEAWPFAFVFTGYAALDAVRKRDHAAAWTAGLTLLGPACWLVNNAVHHGDAFHFLTRVATYRRTHEPVESTWMKLIEYPGAWWTAAPELAALSLVSVLGLRDSTYRARWARPFVCGVIGFGFLVYGSLRDGAPTHHPERALVWAWGLGALMGVDAILPAVRRSRLSAAALGALLVWGFGSVQRWPDFPGQAPEERREAQIALGRALREEGHVTLEPCRYEHFAVIAALGAPERVTTLPLQNQRVTPGCPRVVR